MTSASGTEPSLTVIRRIKAPPQTVFAAFVEPAHILKWGPDAAPTLLAEDGRARRRPVPRRVRDTRWRAA